VADLAVVPVTSRIGEPMLAAFYTSPTGQSHEFHRQLIVRARTVLPSFMVPGRFRVPHRAASERIGQDRSTSLGGKRSRDDDGRVVNDSEANSL